jgi:hypothetical protein
MHSKAYNAIPVAFAISALFFLISTSGCEYYPNQKEACNNCLNAKPDSGNLVIRFDPASFNNPVKFQVYEGGYETGRKVLDEIATDAVQTYLLETGKTYSVAATYNYHGHTTIVVDHGKIRTRKYGCSDSSDGEVTHYCWYAIPAEVDVQLKNEH